MKVNRSYQPAARLSQVVAVRDTGFVRSIRAADNDYLPHGTTFAQATADGLFTMYIYALTTQIDIELLLEVAVQAISEGKTEFNAQTILEGN